MQLIQHLPIKRLILLISGILLAVFLFLPARTGAEDIDTKHQLCTGANIAFQQSGAGCAKVSDGNGGFRDATEAEKADSRLNKLVVDVINIISVIVGVIAVIMVIYGGFRFVTSAGNPEGTKAGRNAILYAIIGLIIVAFAQLIVKFVLSKAVGVVEP